MEVRVDMPVISARYASDSIGFKTGTCTDDLHAAFEKRAKERSRQGCDNC